MKKVLLVFVAMVAVFGLAACNGGKVLESEDKNYWATGQFASWGDAVGNDEYKMEAVALKDARIKSLKKSLKNATVLYVAEITLPEGEAGWTVEYKINGEVVTVDGNLTVKLIQTAIDDEENIPEWWGQSPESSKITNLTPETLYIPPFVEENVDEAGTWNDNPIAFEAGDYVMVFGILKDNSKVMGLIKK